MKITFIIPHAIFTGGIRVVFECADLLCEAGHTVTIVFPAVWRDLKYFQARDLFGTRNKIREMRTHFEFARMKPNIDRFPDRATLLSVPNLLPRYIPDGDIIFATAVETAEWVCSHPKEKGDKWYFVQGEEKWVGEERMIASWRLPLKRVTVGSRLKESIIEKAGVDCYGPVLMGINFDEFYHDREYLKNGLSYDERIGLMYHPYQEKGTNDGIAAFRIAKKQFPNLKLVLVGKSRPKPEEIPDEHEFYYNPQENDMRKIYSSCAIWLAPSWGEGFGFMAAEAMACKCAVVSTDVGAIREYSVPGRSCLLSPIRAPETLAFNLISLLGDSQKRKDVAEKGYQFIRRFTWEKAVGGLLKIINENSSTR